MANVVNGPKPQPQANSGLLVFGGLLITSIILLIVFVIVPYFTPSQKSNVANLESQITIPPGACKCISDNKVRSPGSSPVDQQYQSIESKDNATFCGFEQNGYKWACKPSDCTPACV
jgi:hypothetical protein